MRMVAGVRVHPQTRVGVGHVRAQPPRVIDTLRVYGHPPLTRRSKFVPLSLCAHTRKRTPRADGGTALFRGQMLP